MVEKIYASDSYIVNVIPPGTTFPVIRIIRRRKKREPSTIAEDIQIGPPLGNAHAYDAQNIDEIARQIGKAILDDSEVIRNWRANRP